MFALQAKIIVVFSAGLLTQTHVAFDDDEHRRAFTSMVVGALAGGVAEADVDALADVARQVFDAGGVFESGGIQIFRTASSVLPKTVLSPELIGVMAEHVAGSLVEGGQSDDDPGQRYDYSMDDLHSGFVRQLLTEAVRDIS